MDWDKKSLKRGLKAWKAVGDQAKKILAERDKPPPLPILTAEEEKEKLIWKLAKLRELTIIINRAEGRGTGDWMDGYKYKFAKSLKRAMEWDIMETMPRGKICH